MSYLRGKYYVWSGSDGVHLWAFDGEDGWKDTGWGVAVKEWKTKRGQGPSGVCLPEPVLDEFVVMRLAELVDEGKVSGTIRRALKKWAGNGGALSLAYHAEAIIRRIGSMKPDPKRLTQREFFKKQTSKRFGRKTL